MVTPNPTGNESRRVMNEIVDLFMQDRATQESLANALTELEELDDYAAESGLTPPAPVAKNSPVKFLRFLLPEHRAIIRSLCGKGVT